MHQPYSLSKENGYYLLRVTDLLNEFANRKTMKAVRAQIGNGFSNFVVDLSGIDYMNSVGINFLIQIKHLAKASGGKVAVINPSRKVVELLKMTKLLPMFYLTDSMDDAEAFLVSND